MTTTIKDITATNLLITRRCNLSCWYCGISSKDEQLKYKDLEKSDEWWLTFLDKFSDVNPDCFHIIYGGEPLLRLELLIEICKLFNNKNVGYTIITNGLLRDRLIKLLESVNVRGLSCSVDPSVVDADGQDLPDPVKKSINGISTLLLAKREYGVSDVVAEVTATAEDIEKLPKLVSILSEYGICSDITLIDLKKNEYYDFSTESDPTRVPSKEVVERVFQKILNDDKALVHMKEKVLTNLPNFLPADNDCRIEEKFHNLTVDADGAIRLCLRIRGDEVTKYNAFDLFDKFDEIHAAMIRDKKKMCQGCNWTCMIHTFMGSYDEMVNH